MATSPQSLKLPSSPLLTSPPLFSSLSALHLWAFLSILPPPLLQLPSVVWVSPLSACLQLLLHSAPVHLICRFLSPLECSEGVGVSAFVPSLCFIYPLSLIFSSPHPLTLLPLSFIYLFSSSLIPSSPLTFSSLLIISPVFKCFIAMFFSENCLVFEQIQLSISELF